MNRALAREFVWGERFPEPVALIDYTAAGQQGAGTAEPFYYLLDALGSVVALVDEGGEVVERYTYEPYGTTLISNADGSAIRAVSAYGNPFGFTGQRYDAAVGLYHFRHRSYSPRLGRWLQLDPAGYSDGVSLFEYVRSNPITGFDPWGLEATDDDVGEVIGRYQQHRKQAQQKIEKASAVVIETTNTAYKMTGIHTVAAVGFRKDLTKPPAEASLSWGEWGDEAAWAAGGFVGARLLGKLIGRIRAIRYGDDVKDLKNTVDGVSDVAKLTDDVSDGTKTTRCTVAPAAPPVPQGTAYRLGRAASNDYRATFFKAHPDLKGKVIVHHGIEQQVLTRYPGRFTEAEIHSLENLRGIPKSANSELHLSRIRTEWNDFYRRNPNATREQILEKATDIDSRLGSGFTPPSGG